MVAARGSVASPVGTTSRMGQLALADVVDMALGNNPETRATWNQARAAAASVGSANGRYLPTLSLDVNGGPSQAISTAPGRFPSQRTIVTPTLSLSYLLFDFGARQGVVEAARQALYAADLTHNATLQAVVLQAEGAYFAYQASRGLLAAQQATLETAEANLAAAQQRHDVGLATIADVLQARTALAQARLTLQTAQGNLQAGRATLAAAMGIVPTVPFEVVADSGATVVHDVAAGVDSLIELAVRGRPDLEAVRAQARQSEAQIRSARSAVLPSISVGGTTGRSFANVEGLQGNTYAVTLGLSIPLFSGLSRQYDVVAAQEQAAAALARTETTRLQVAQQVFTSYYALRTATERVASANELLVSATQSQEVAAGRYREGVGSILDLLTAQSALADARAQQVQARWTWSSALAQLAHDVGVLDTRGNSPLTLTTGSPGGR